jgi:endonuclease/exonuclease/phosphatase family metal-dependent hydrolase
VRDLVGALKTDYNYIHRTSGDSRGIDQALLYKGDKFFPDADDEAVRLLPSGMGREFLSVRGELRGGRRVELVVCHMASKLNAATLRRRNMQALRAALGRILAADPCAAVIVMGDMNATPDDRMVRDVFGPVDDPSNVMHAPHAAGRSAREGSYSYRGRRYLYDWMIVSPAVASGEALRVEGCGVFARDFMTESARGSGGTKTVRPHRTFSGGDYRGGASDHLPVWMVVSHD